MSKQAILHQAISQVDFALLRSALALSGTEADNSLVAPSIMDEIAGTLLSELGITPQQLELSPMDSDCYDALHSASTGFCGMLQRRTARTAFELVNASTFNGNGYLMRSAQHALQRLHKLRSRWCSTNDERVIYRRSAAASAHDPLSRLEASELLNYTVGTVRALAAKSWQKDCLNSRVTLRGLYVWVRRRVSANAPTLGQLQSRTFVNSDLDDASTDALLRSWTGLNAKQFGERALLTADRNPDANVLWSAATLSVDEKKITEYLRREVLHSCRHFN